MTSTLCLVESNRLPGNTTGLVRAAAARGLRVIIATAEADSLADLALPDVEVLVVDTTSSAAIVAALRARPGLDLVGLTTAHEFYTPVAAAAAAQLGLPGPSAAAVARCRSKDRQREALAAAEVSQPTYAVCFSAAEAVDSLGTIGLPAVVKPVALAESIGVRLCRTAAEVAAHAEALLGSDAFATRRPVPGAQDDRVLVEEVAHGREFAVEVMDGIVVGASETTLGLPPLFVELQHAHPPVMEPDELATVYACAAQACRGLELTYGPVHVELRLHEGVARIIEVNPRLAGGQIPALYLRTLGRDLWDATVSASCGLAPLPPAPPSAAAATIRFLELARDGAVDFAAALTGFPLAGEHVEVFLLDEEAAPDGRPTRSSDIAGWAIADGPTVVSCVATLDAMWSRLDARVRLLQV